MNTYQSELDGFYNMKTMWTPELVHNLAWYMAKDKAQINQTQMLLSAKNPWLHRQMKDLSQFEQLKKFGRTIETQIDEQRDDLIKVKSGTNNASKQLNELQNEIEKASQFVLSTNSSQQAIHYQIQTIKVELNRLNMHREQLKGQVQYYASQKHESRVGEGISVPSEYFVQLQKHHEHLIKKYDTMVNDAEVLVDSIDNQVKRKALSKTNEEQSETQKLREMKKQIFEICQLIFDQQQETAAQLQSIERNIQLLK